MILPLLLLALQDTPSAPASAPQDAAGVESWWQGLSPEERDRLHQRWGQYQNLSPERREALRKRMEAIEQERSMTWRRLGEPERRQFESWEEPERRRWLDERVRERLRERGQELERRDPGFRERLRDLPPEDRERRAENFLREDHLDRAKAELERAVQEGWIGPAAAEWLRQAPPHELLTAVGQVQRWRFLQRAEREGFWQQHRVSPEQRMQMLELPTPFFFEEVRRLQRGEPPAGPPGEAPLGPPRGPPPGAQKGPPPGPPREGRHR